MSSEPIAEHNPLPCPHERTEYGGTRLICRDCGASLYINPGAMLGRRGGPLAYWVAAEEGDSG